MEKQLRIRKSNKLNEARFQLSKTEYRILLLCVAKIKPKTQDVDSKYQIDVTEYAELFGVSLKNAYKQIEEGLDSAWERVFYERIPVTRARKAGWRERRFVITREYFPGDGYGEVEFHPDFLQHLIDLREQYNDYALRNVAYLPSFNVIRIYELLIQFRTVGLRSFDVNWFRELLCLEDSYSRFGDLRTHVINPALQAIDQHTDLDIIKDGNAWITIHKRGRKVVMFEVRFRYKSQQTLELDETEVVETPAVEPEWKARGFATLGEFREAQGAESRYNISFDTAGDFYRFKTKLNRGL